MPDKTNFVPKYSRQQKLRSFHTIRDGKKMGPSFVCYGDGTLRDFDVLSNGLRVGTQFSWLEYGDKREETYYCLRGDAYIVRTYIVDRLDVIEWPFESTKPISSWEAGYEQENPPPSFQHIDVPILLDPAAESSWCTTDDVGLSDELPRWSNGQVAFLGCRYGNFPSGAAVTFWENGAVRTVAHWDDDGVIGTRSCFADSGDLIAEQNFFRNGWKSGYWVNRHFTWEEDFPKLSKVEIFQGFELVETLASPIVKNVLDEASFNYECDPLYGRLRRVRYAPSKNQYNQSDESEDLIDWKEIAQRQCGQD